MRRFLIATFVFAIFVIPVLGFAQPPETGGIVPCDGVIEQCQACHFIQLGNNLLRWIIGIMASIIALVFVFGGLKMVMSAGDTHAVSEARGMMTNAIVGFVILLAAWLIVDTVLKVIVNKNDQGVNQRIGVGMWNKIECVIPPEKNAAPTGTITNGDSGQSGGVRDGVPGSIGVKDVNGNIQQVSLRQSQSDSALNTNYEKVKNKYATQISSACQNSSVPNCTQVMTALIANESRGDPSASSPSGSLGIMQLIPANGGRICGQNDTSCIQSQINKGASMLNNLYANNNAVDNNLPNTFAGYNSGGGTAEGTSASGRRPALAPSQDCTGLLAYQCSINPGGLIETQAYVANICRTLTLQGLEC